MSLNLEGKFVVLEYDSSRVDPGPALILLQLKNSRLVTEYDPKDYPGGQLDMDECEEVRRYLKGKNITEIYSPREIIPMPETLFGLALNFDNEFERGLYRPLGKHYWIDFFSKEGITLKEFDPNIITWN